MKNKNKKKDKKKQRILFLSMALLASFLVFFSVLAESKGGYLSTFIGRQAGGGLAPRNIENKSAGSNIPSRIDSGTETARRPIAQNPINSDLGAAKRLTIDSKANNSGLGSDPLSSTEDGEATKNIAPKPAKGNVISNFINKLRNREKTSDNNSVPSAEQYNAPTNDLGTYSADTATERKEYIDGAINISLFDDYSNIGPPVEQLAKDGLNISRTETFDVNYKGTTETYVRYYVKDESGNEHPLSFNYFILGSDYYSVDDLKYKYYREGENPAWPDEMTGDISRTSPKKEEESEAGVPSLADENLNSTAGIEEIQVVNNYSGSAAAGVAIVSPKIAEIQNTLGTNNVGFRRLAKKVASNLGGANLSAVSEIEKSYLEASTNGKEGFDGDMNDDGRFTYADVISVVQLHNINESAASIVADSASSGESTNVSENPKIKFKVSDENGQVKEEELNKIGFSLKVASGQKYNAVGWVDGENYSLNNEGNSWYLIVDYDNPNLGAGGSASNCQSGYGCEYSNN